MQSKCISEYVITVETYLVRPHNQMAKCVSVCQWQFKMKKEFQFNNWLKIFYMMKV